MRIHQRMIHFAASHHPPTARQNKEEDSTTDDTTNLEMLCTWSVSCSSGDAAHSIPTLTPSPSDTPTHNLAAGHLIGSLLLYTRFTAAKSDISARYTPTRWTELQPPATLRLFNSSSILAKFEKKSQKLDRFVPVYGRVPLVSTATASNLFDSPTASFAPPSSQSIPPDEDGLCLVFNAVPFPNNGPDPQHSMLPRARSHVRSVHVSL